MNHTTDGARILTAVTRDSSRRLLTVLAALVFALLANPVPAGAHGGTTRIGSATAGPYRVRVASTPSPRVGVVDVSVAVTEPGGRPVKDATVSTTVSRPDSPGEEARYEGELEDETPSTHHASISFPTSGSWELLVRVVGAEGQGDARLGAGVSPVLWGVTPSELLIGSAPLLILIVVVVARRFRRSEPPQQELRDGSRA